MPQPRPQAHAGDAAHSHRTKEGKHFLSVAGTRKEEKEILSLGEREPLFTFILLVERGSWARGRGQRRWGLALQLGQCKH